MPVNRTFEDLLKDKIIADLLLIVVDRTVILTNDINLAAMRKTLVGNEVFGAIATGGGQRMGVGEGVTQPILINFAIPIDFREDFLEKIVDYAKDESNSLGQNLPGTGTAIYYFKANYLVPSCNGIVYLLNGKNYVEVILSGTVYYGDELIDDTVTIANSSLVGIISTSGSATQNDEVIEIEGLKSQLIITNSISDIKSYRILYDADNTLHTTLKGYLDNASTLPDTVAVSVNSQSMTCKMSLTKELINGFLFIDITLKRTATYA